VTGQIEVDGAATAEEVAAVLAAVRASRATSTERTETGYEGWRRTRLDALRRPGP
jgi:hypothetical protein